MAPAAALAFPAAGLFELIGHGLLPRGPVYPGEPDESIERQRIWFIGGGFCCPARFIRFACVARDDRHVGAMSRSYFRTIYDRLDTP